MLIPNPILLGGPTPPGGLTLEVTAGRGDLAGYILLGLLGPPCAVDVRQSGAWQAVTYPCTLAPGDELRLTRTDESGAVTMLRALAPVDDGPLPEPGIPDPYTVATDPDGYQTITNTEATTDAEGYQTIQDATATADPDGYESVERST